MRAIALGLTILAAAAAHPDPPRRNGKELPGREELPLDSVSPRGERAPPLRWTTRRHTPDGWTQWSFNAAMTRDPALLKDAKRSLTVLRHRLTARTSPRRSRLGKRRSMSTRLAETGTTSIRPDPSRDLRKGSALAYDASDYVGRSARSTSSPGSRGSFGSSPPTAPTPTSRDRRRAAVLPPPRRGSAGRNESIR